MQDDVYSTDQQLAPALAQHFQIPQLLLLSVHRRSNGFFTFEECLNADGELQVYCM
jgi:hypothetical protein